MKEDIKRIYQVLIILGVGILLLVLGLSIPVFHNSVDFSIYNPGWNGCSGLALKTYRTGQLQPTFYFEQTDFTVGQRSFAEYDLNPGNSSIFIIGPRSDFSKTEISYLARFLEAGGRVLLADDFGTGNQVLQGLNLDSRFSNSLLLDLSFEKKASFVTVFNLVNSSHPLMYNVSRVLLNYPSSIKPGRNASILASSSELSWLDKNGNMKEDDHEPGGPFPVIAMEKYGKGELVLISDPSLFINSMQKQLDNQEFRANLLVFFTKGRGSMIIDESHRDTPQPFSWSYILPDALLRGIKIGIILLIVCLFILFFTELPLVFWRRIKKMFLRGQKTKRAGSKDEIVDELLKKHPDWDEKSLNDMLRGMGVK